MQRTCSNYRSLFDYSIIHDKHISAFLVQLLDRVGLCQSWKDIIEPLAIKVCQMVSINHLSFLKKDNKFAVIFYPISLSNRDE